MKYLLTLAIAFWSEMALSSQEAPGQYEPFTAYSIGCELYSAQGYNFSDPFCKTALGAPVGYVFSSFEGHVDFGSIHARAMGNTNVKPNNGPTGAFGNLSFLDYIQIEPTNKSLAGGSRHLEIQIIVYSIYLPVAF